MVHSRHHGSSAQEASVSLGNSGPGRDPEEVLAELTEKTKRNTTDKQRRRGIPGRENSRCKICEVGEHGPSRGLLSF